MSIRSRRFAFPGSGVAFAALLASASVHNLGNAPSVVHGASSVSRQAGSAQAGSAYVQNSGSVHATNAGFNRMRDVVHHWP
jgi:hypothetical protein